MPTRSSMMATVVNGHLPRGTLPVAVIATLFACAHAAAAEPLRDLTAVPLEQLLAVEVQSASRFPQKTTEAPASVTVITANDIRDFGYRTLAEVLGSIRALYVTYDRNYHYLGIRGFARPSDYNSRVLLLVDGLRTNDNIYNTAPIGTDFPVDLDLIERIEFVPGPGSSIYGSNAFFGVLNVITKRGSAIGAMETALGAGSHGTNEARVSFGREFDDGTDLLVSVSGLRRRGADLQYDEFVPLGIADGMARGLDGDRAARLFGRVSRGPWTLQLIHAVRDKSIPTASFGTAPAVPGTRTTDEVTWLDARYAGNLGNRTEINARAFYGRYAYDGSYVYDLPPLSINRDQTRGNWWGAEAKILSTAWDGHRAVFGAEFQADPKKSQRNYTDDPYSLALDDHRSSRRFALYAQDEIAFAGNLLLNAGLRYDRSQDRSGVLNPRLALIYPFMKHTVAKLLYGTAYREPNAYESFYAAAGAGGQKPNPGLRAEHIRTVEAVIEHNPDERTRIVGSVFRYNLRDMINSTLDPADGLTVFGNLDGARASGAGFEVERAWISGQKLRASYSWQHAVDNTGTRLTNAPAHLAKLNLSGPLPGTGLRYGAEVQYTSSRSTATSETRGFFLVNVNLVAARLARDLEVSANLRNLLDRRYADPGGSEHVQDSIVQDGRTFLVRLRYRFR